MKLREFLVVFLISIASVAIVVTTDSIIVMTPSVWLCDQSWNQSILVDLLPNSLNTDNLKLELLIKNKQEADKFVKLEETIDRTGFKKIQFNLPSSFESGTYLIEVKATGNNYYYFNDTFKYIDCQANENGVYIITDKSVYRDSDKVLIKIISIDSYLMPVTGQNASIYIKDPNDNTIAQFLNVTFQDGLIDNLMLQLSDRPTYGKWKIQTVLNKIKKEIYFTVNEYVLPRFDFKVDVPSYILKSSNELEVNVDAQYTYGQPLPGSANIELIIRYYLHPSYKEESYFKNIQLTNGKAKILLPLNKEIRYQTYRLNVTVSEQFTNKSLSLSKEVGLKLVSREFYVSTDIKHIVPNKTNTIKIKLFYLNHKPYAEKKMNINLIERSSYWHILNYQSFTMQTDQDGLLVLEKDIGNIDSIEIYISLADDSTQSTSIFLQKELQLSCHTSESMDTKLLIELMNKKEYNSFVNLKISKIEAEPNECYEARYFILSGFQIFNQNVIEICDQVNVEINLTTLYAPSSTFVIYLVDSRKNVIARSFELKNVNFYQNDLKIEFGKNVTEPGEVVEIKLKTKPGSLVGLSIIDKSIELLQPPNELTKTDITNQIDRFKQLSKNRDMSNVWKCKKSDGFKILNDVGLIFLRLDKRIHAQYLIMSDNINQKMLLRKKENELNHNINQNIMFREIENKLNHNRNEKLMSREKDNDINVVKESKRADFRETWIWQTVKIKNENETSIFSKIPDTITTWVASGFSLHNQYGLAIADKQQITTFKGFFVSMILPPSMIRGEILTVQCIVYNYMDEDLKDVKVYFGKTEDSELIQNDNIKKRSVDKDEDITRVIDEIKSQTSKLVEFQITPTKVGQLMLTVTAVSNVAGDGETRKLKVKPEGIQETINQAVLVDLRNYHQIVHDFHIRIPENRIDDSAHCTVQIIGDLLGPSLNNLNRLINKPFGCGEQNMITLTPNIYALKYLLASLTKNSQIKNVDMLIVSAKNNILFGYQNELKYFRRDGSFSAFGDSDNHGSTWLTAFVVKSFAQATEYVKTDDKVLSKAVDFLISQQNEDGSFKEPGKIIHQDMQGGANGKTSITAYVTIALIESKLNEKSVIKSIEQATAYLQKEIKTLTDDVYTLGLATFALNLAKSDKAKQYFDIFQTKSINLQDGKIYWSKMPNTDSSSDIELTAYGLLLNLLQNDVSTSLSIVKYLIGKSNSLGTYSNTQNTVLALQALSQFGVQVMLNDRASSTDPSNINLHVNQINQDDKINKNNETSKQFNVNDENSIVLQIWELPDCEGKVNLNASGNGIALFQLITTYNVPNVTEPRIFDLKQTTVKTNSKIVKVKTCATYYQQSSPSKQQSTGMTLIEASLLSGHTVDKEELQKLVDSKTIEYLKFFEVKYEKVVFYLDQLDDATPVCIEWKMFKVNKVDNLKPVPVRVYDYYQNNLQYDILYSV